MGYEFYPEQIVVVVRATKVEGFHRVEEQKHGIVTLQDGSRWYAQSGLPVAGSAQRRMTPLNPATEKMALKKGKALRLVELASVIGEYLDSPLRATESEIYRAEKALLVIAKSLRPSTARGSLFLEGIERRMKEAEKGAIELLR